MVRQLLQFLRKIRVPNEAHSQDLNRYSQEQIHIFEEIIADRQELDAEYRKIADEKRLEEIDDSQS